MMNHCNQDNLDILTFTFELDSLDQDLVERIFSVFILL